MKRRRRRKHPDSRKSALVGCWMTPEDKLQLMIDAESQDMTPSAFIRELWSVWLKYKKDRTSEHEELLANATNTASADATCSDAKTVRKSKGEERSDAKTDRKSKGRE